MGRSSSTPTPLSFKRRFKPKPVVIEDVETEAKYEFTTQFLSRGAEREMDEAPQKAVEVVQEMTTDEDGNEIEFDADEVNEAMLKVFLGLLDKMIAPEKGKKKLASAVLLDMWKKDLIETADVTDFFEEVAKNRRPT